jgi:predicted Kef-type K+ transport protein
MSLGIAIILKRGLLFVRFFDDLTPSKQPTELLVIGLALYFACTAIYALRCALKRRFVSHQRWIIRHVASGIWIAIQRILVLTIYPAIYQPPVAREVQRRVFGEAGIIATVVSLAMGEYTLFLFDQQKVERSD